MAQVFRNLAKRASNLYLLMRDEYDPMLEEHRVLDKTLARLRRVAEEEGHLTDIRFAELLSQHFLGEDQMFYPAAVMVGRLALQKAKTGR